MKAWAVYFIDKSERQCCEIIASARKPSVSRAVKLAGLEEEDIDLDEVIIHELTVFTEGKYYAVELKEIKDEA